MNSEEYKYKGLPITPAITEDLIIKLFSGKLVERKIIVEAVLNYHTKNGGSKPKARDFSRSVKKSLGDLQKKGLVENPGYGYWKIGTTDEFIEIADAPINVEQEIDYAISPDEIIGSGESCVYVYYLEAYRERAELKKEKFWPCKIGLTKNNSPENRVLSQVGTALPEIPRIGLVIRTNKPRLLEKSLHNILEFKGRKIDSSPGSEWFLTSPNEIKKIFEFLETAFVENFAT